MTEVVWLAGLFALSSVPLLISLPILAKKRPGFGVARFLWAIFAGLVAIIPVTLLQALAPPPGRGIANLLFRAFIAVAAVEEGAKYITLRLFRKKWGGEQYAVSAGVASSLAFALFETLVYASTNVSALLLRAVTATPLHAACGAWVGRAAIEGRLFYLLCAVVVHGVYDLSLFVPGFPAIIPVLIAAGSLAIALQALREN